MLTEAEELELLELEEAEYQENLINKPPKEIMPRKPLTVGSSPIPGQSFGDFTDTLIHGLGQGASLGFMDELIGMSDPRLKAIHRARSEKLSKDAPTASTLAEIAGGALSGKALYDVLKPSTWAKVAGLGAGEGAAYGAGTAPDMESISSNMGLGAALGTIGGLLPAGFDAGKRAWVNLRQKDTKPITALQEMMFIEGKKLNDMNPTSSRESLLSMLGDTGIANARVIGAKDPQSRLDIQKFVNQQVAPSKGNIDEALNKLNSSRGLDYFTDANRLKQIQKDNASNLYPQAMRQPLVVNDTIKDIMQLPTMRKAYNEMRRDVKATGGSVAKGYKGKKFTDTEIPMDAVQRLKFKLDEQARLRANPMSRQKDTTYRTRTVRDRLMDETSEDFQLANEVYAGDASINAAIEQGRKGLTQKHSDRMEYIKDLNQSESDAYLSGFISSVKDKLLTTPKDAATSYRFLKSEGVKETLDKLSPNAGSLMDTLEVEERFQDIARRVVPPSGISSTIDPSNQTGRGVAKLATIPASGAASLLSEGIEKLRGMKPKEFQRLANLLADPAKTDEAIRLLKKKGLSEQQIKQVSQMSKQLGVVFATTPSITTSDN